MSSLTVNPVNDANDVRDNYASDGWKPAYLSSATTSALKVSSEKRGSSPTYEICRSGFAFDTSSLPDTCTISAAKIRVYCMAKANNLGSSTLYIVPLSAATGGGTYTITNLGSLAYDSWGTSAYNEISLNATGLAQINKTGNTILGMVEYYDFSNTTPGSVAANAYDLHDYGEANKPELVVTYAIGATVTTTAVSSITSRTASSGGNVTSDGGGTITERGICYNTAGTPTTSDTKVTAAGTTGEYTSNMTGLSPNRTYYVRAYVITEAGTSYGAEEDFTTLSEGGFFGLI